MDIQQQTADVHSIQSYSDTDIVVQAIKYHTALLITASTLITDWDIQTIRNLTPEHFNPILSMHPELILIGHAEAGKYPPPATIQWLNAQRIGIECMSIGAACRTFNVLLSENRQVVLGFIPTT